MKKGIISIALLLALVVSAISFTSCSLGKPEEGTVTRMTVDINPSVEFMIDEEKRIVSVTALNDDGGILIVGEAFVGKTAEEAVEMMVTLASDTGYLVGGNADADENTVKISISGDSKYAQRLQKSITDKAYDTLKALNINGRVEKAEAMKIEGLRQLALSTSLYTEEEVNAMEEEQLYKVIAAGRVETALLLTEEMRSAYYSAKEYEISFAQREETARIIKELGGLYNLTHTTYKAALDLYSTAISELDDFRYEMLVSPESEYQKSLAKLRESKVELLKQKNHTASLDVNGEEYASATVTLQLAEENYDKLLAAYEKLGTERNASREALIANLRLAEAKLVEQAAEIEASMNAAKDGFFTEFESAHAQDIEALEQTLLAKKQQMISEMESVE